MTELCQRWALFLYALHVRLLFEVPRQSWGPVAPDHRRPEQYDVLLAGTEAVRGAGAVEAQSQAAVGIDEDPELAQGEVAVGMDDAGRPRPVRRSVVLIADEW